MDSGVLRSFSQSFRSPHSLAAGRSPSCLLLGLPVPHVCIILGSLYGSRSDVHKLSPRVPLKKAEESSRITALLCPNATTVAGVGYPPIIPIGI